MDAMNLPAQIGLCEHCQLPLYAHAPVSTLPPLAHVACALDARREHGPPALH